MTTTVSYRKSQTTPTERAVLGEAQNVTQVPLDRQKIDFNNSLCAEMCMGHLTMPKAGQVSNTSGMTSKNTRADLQGLSST